MTAPEITSITPSIGPASGGTQVSIAGSGLSSVTKVLFGTDPTAKILSITDSLIVAVSPGGSTLGLVDIEVDSPNGPAIWFRGFDFQLTIDSILPASGPVAGGTSVDIKGSGLLQIYGLKFNDTPAMNFITKSDGLLTVVTPAATAPGSADISLLDLFGKPVYIEFGGFTYLAAAQPAPPPGNPAGAGTPPPPAPPPATGKPPAATPPAAGTPDPAAGTPATPKPGGTPKAGTPDPTGATSDPGSATPGTPKSTPPAGATADPGTAKPPATTPAPAAGAPGPTPSGDYIPGGRMVVPGGQTGLGGTAGTGAGFGVGTLIAGGGGSAAPSNLQPYVDPALTAQLVQTLIGLVQNAASPDALEAQNIILRRIALEGDVIGSRIPPPRNISEIGGYINLLGTLKENAVREQAIAGILGVAGPPQPLGWVSNTQALAMVAITNDRPAVAAQPTFPLTVLVRSDFVSGVQGALKTLHSFGATLPLVGPPVILLPPGGPGAPQPSNLLQYLGRTLTIAPSAALAHPASDPVAILVPSGAMTDYALASQVLSAAANPVPPADLQAVQCTPTSKTIVPMTQVSFIPIAPILASAGFYSPSPLPVPPNSGSRTWASLTNQTGLVAGETKLGQELALLYRPDQIANSSLAAILTWTWNGTSFVP